MSVSMSQLRNILARRVVMVIPAMVLIPVGALAQTHRIDVALLGFGLPDDAIHAPNERFYLPNLLRGTEACIELYWYLGHG